MAYCETSRNHSRKLTPPSTKRTYECDTIIHLETTFRKTTILNFDFLFRSTVLYFFSVKKTRTVTLSSTKSVMIIINTAVTETNLPDIFHANVAVYIFIVNEMQYISFFFLFDNGCNRFLVYSFYNSNFNLPFN